MMISLKYCKNIANPVSYTHLDYAQPHSPSSVELAKELNGYALEDLYDPNGNLMYKKGQLLNGFAHLRDDGTTTSGNWLRCV